LRNCKPKIIIAKSGRNQPADLPYLISELERLAQTDTKMIVAQLQNIVPEYCVPMAVIPFGAQLDVSSNRRIAA
jgi:hypothetical protein